VVGPCTACTTCTKFALSQPPRIVTLEPLCTSGERARKRERDSPPNPREERASSTLTLHFASPTCSHNLYIYPAHNRNPAKLPTKHIAPCARPNALDMWWFLRATAFVISHVLIVLTIPLAFDVGGRECGLAFSLSLAAFYFVQSLLRLITPPGSTYRKLIETLIRGTSWFTVLFLLIWSLNKFSVDAPGTGWVARTFGAKRTHDASIKEWIFGRGGLLESASIGGWDKLLRWSIPVFQIGEGFCSLLVIQAVGQISRWAVNQEHGDSWMVR